MKVLVIVDVQQEFSKFIQGDLVDELYDYAKQFKQVYQIWDTHKTDVSPTYKFPNQVDSIKKLYGKNHFSDKIKQFIKKVEDDTFEGNTFKLSNGEGYIVRVDNNHDWFYVNEEIVELIGKLKDKEIILVGGADNECLEDVYQAFKAFGLNVTINKKYVYSAKTDQNDSIEDKVNESLDFNSTQPFQIKCDKSLVLEVEKFLIDKTPLKWQSSGKKYIFLGRFTRDYVYFVINRHGSNILVYSDTNDYNIPTYEINNMKDFHDVLQPRPSYKPKKFDRTLEHKVNEIVNTHKYPYRFKTKEEFEKEYGSRWRIKVNFNYDGDMDYLCGQEYTYSLKQIKDDGYYDVDDWVIEKDMLTDNIQPKPNYKPKKFDRTLEHNSLTESVNTYKYPYRFKTKEEFEKEYGLGWRSEVHFNSSGKMDYLFGKEYPWTLKQIQNFGYIGIGEWTIFDKMLTKNIEIKPNYRPKKFNRTLESFLSEVKKNI